MRTMKLAMGISKKRDRARRTGSGRTKATEVNGRRRRTFLTLVALCVPAAAVRAYDNAVFLYFVVLGCRHDPPRPSWPQFHVIFVASLLYL